MLDEILAERRKQGCDKSTSTSYKIESLKHLRPQRHNPSNSPTRNLLSPVITSPVIQPLSVTGVSSASCAQLTINPQLLTHFFASTDQRHHVGAGRDRDGHSVMLEREHKLSETGNQEKLHRLGQESVEKDYTSGIHKEPGRRVAKFQEDARRRREEAEKTEGLDDIEKVIIGRKASKKHKSK